MKGKITKEEFIAWHKGTEQGKIRAWKHIINLCKSCIRAHQEELRAKRIEELWGNYKQFHGMNR